MTRTYTCGRCGGAGHNIRTCGTFQEEYGATRRNYERLKTLFAAKDRRIEDLTYALEYARADVERLQRLLDRERAVTSAQDVLIDQLWTTCAEMKAELDRLRAGV